MDADKTSASRSFKRFLILLATTLSTQTFLAGCEGGGGGNQGGGAAEGAVSGNKVQSPEPVQPELSSTTQLVEAVAITDDLSPLTLENSPALLMTLYEFMSLGEMVLTDYMTGTMLMPPVRYVDFDSDAIPCNWGGYVHAIYDGSEDLLTIAYDDCREGNGSGTKTTLSGTERIQWVQEAGANRIVREFHDLYVDTDDLNAHLNGVAELVFSYSDTDASYVILNLETHEPAVGTLRGNNIRFDYLPDRDASKSGAPIAASGRIEFPSHGVADIAFFGPSPVPSAHGRFTLRGASQAEANLDYGEPHFLVFGYDPDGDGANDHSTNFRVREDYDSLKFTSLSSTNPVRLNSDSRLFVEDEPIIGQPIEFNVHPYFTDENGQLLTYSVELLRVENREMSWLAHEITAESSIDFSITQPESGHFELIARSPMESASYIFEVQAIGPTGLLAAEPLQVVVPMYMDSDGDGTADVSDTDDDNDGVADSSDAFPKDPSESRDADGDGIGNNADDDDDGDGYADVEDLRPADPLCALASDIEDGQCLQRRLLKRHKFLDREGVLYFWSTTDSKIYRWNSTTEHFLAPLILNPEFAPTDSLLEAPYYASDQHALYIRYRNSSYTRIDLTDPALTESRYPDPENHFSNTAYIADSTAQFVALRSRDETNTSYASFDLDGNIVDTFTVANTGDRFQAADFVPFCAGGVSLDPDTGEFAEFGTGDCSNFSSDSRLFTVSPDRQRAITGDAKVIDSTGAVIAELPVDIYVNSVRWTDEGLYSMDLPFPGGSVHRFSKDGMLLDRMPLPGGLLHQIFGEGNHFILVSENNKYVQLRKYQADE